MSLLLLMLLLLSFYLLLSLLIIFLLLHLFVYYNYVGIKTHGVVKYFKHFTGPVWWLAWLMFPVEIVSHFSRIISLSFRLFGNIKGDDLFLWVLLMLVPFVAPLPAYLLLTFSALLQTFVFMILIYVYLAGAVAIDEEHHEKTPDPVVDTMGAV